MATPSASRSDPAQTRRRRASRGKYEQILDAAVELFLANGFDQTSMDAIAARAGVSKTTVYAHHTDKLALFRAVVDRSGEALAVQMDERLLDAGQDPEARLSQIVLAVLEATTRPDFRAFLRVMVTESARRPDLGFATERALVDVVGLLASALEEEGRRQGYELPGPRAHATGLLRMAVSGPQLDSLLFADFRPDHELLQAHARWVTGIFLWGIAPRTDGTHDMVAPIGGGYPWLPEAAVQTH